MSVTQTQGVNYPNTSAGKLPILVGLLAILVGLFGAFLAVVGILVIFNSLGALSYPGLVPFNAFGGTTLVAGMFTLIFGAILLIVAMGLWDLETWALWLTGIVTAGVIVVLLWSASFGVALAVAVVLLIYLIAVRKHFY
jgi:lysylphosphatidylglycerol synthetase-like protein (DUF2156 family)